MAAWLLTAGAAAWGGVLYAVGPWQVDSPSNLYVVDAATGEATMIGSTGVDRLGGLAYRDGALYAYNTLNLYRIDPATAATELIGPLGTAHPEGGLSFHPGTGELYGTKSLSNDELVRIDVATGVSTPVGLLGPSGRDTSGLAFDATGQLFGVSYRGSDPDLLVKIDSETAAVSVVGELGTPAASPSVGGLGFDPDVGVLYLVSGGKLYRVDTDSGAATEVGATGVADLGGLAVVPAGGACEPCDTNCDGSINGQDIVGFVSALHGSPDPCSPCNSDTDGDGSINGQDIAGFVTCLNGP